MVLSWFSSDPEDVAALVAKRSYGRAAKVLRARLERDPQNVSLELQLADVLQLDGQSAEAVAILLLAADGYARSGFLAKAIALLKKVQRIDPERAAAMDRKIAALAKERDEETARRASLCAPRPSRARAEAAEPRPVLPEPPDATALPAGGPEPPPEPDAPGQARAATPDDGLEFELEISGDDLESAPPAEARLEKTHLFSDFSADELLDVIRGLKLLTFAPGEIVVAEGEPGDSLLVLTTGTVLAFCKDPEGRYRKVREMTEGSFFGEVSILTGSPRTATITAATPIELLELDSGTLAAIAERRPHVSEVLRRFCAERAGSVEEIRIRMGRPGPPPASE